MENIIKDIRLFNKLPYFVILNNEKYKINADFRSMVSIELILQDKTMDKGKKIKKCLQLFYPFFYNEKNFERLLNYPEVYKEACEKLIWFYTCGNRKNYHKSKGKSSNNLRIYDYEYDDEYIYAAFLDKGIDLTKDKVHWWKFKAIFKSLTDNCMFEKIMGYRAYSGDDENLKNLKEYWKLPLSKSEEERIKKLYEELK